MKRMIIAAAALFACVALSAQKKGDKTIGLCGSVSFGQEYVKTHNGAGTNNSSNPLTTTFRVMGDFGYFVADNLRLTLAVSVPFSSDPTEKSGSTWLRNRDVSIEINPSIAYYVKLAENLYYTPEVGFAYSWGSLKEDLTTNTSKKLNYNGWGIYANYLSLEYRISQRFAVGAAFGSIYYYSAKYKQKGSDVYLRDGQFKFSINDAFVNVRFYF